MRDTTLSTQVALIVGDPAISNHVKTTVIHLAKSIEARESHEDVIHLQLTSIGEQIERIAHLVGLPRD